MVAMGSNGDGKQSKPLTPREAEVLDLMTRGLRNAEIGRALQISIKTVCVLGLTIGLSGLRARADEPARAAWLTLRVEAQTQAGAERAVTSASVLRQGDKLRLAVTPARAVHLVVIHVAPSGKAALLYTSGEKRLALGQKLRLPRASEPAYVLDDETGRESLVVIASEAPLALLSEEYAALIRSVQERERLPERSRLLTGKSPASGDAQRAATPVAGVLDLKGPMRGIDDGHGALRAFPDAAGVAIAVLQFDHVR
jgi:hypothetical protein